MHLGHSFFASGSLVLLSSSIASGIALHGPYHLRSRDVKLPVVRIDQKALPNNERNITAYYFPDGDISSGLGSKYHSPTVTVTRGVESKDGKAVGINWCPEQPQPPPTDSKVYWCLDIRPKDGPDGSQGSPDNGDTLRIDMRTNTSPPSIGDSPKREDGFPTTDKDRCVLNPVWQTNGKPPKGPGNSPDNQRTWQCTLPLPWVTLIGATNSTTNATSSPTNPTATSTQPPTTAGTAVSGSPPNPTMLSGAKYMNSTANSTDSDNSSSTTTHFSDSPTDYPYMPPDWFKSLEEHGPEEQINYDYNSYWTNKD